MPFANITIKTRTSGFEDLEGDLDKVAITDEPAKGFLQAATEFANARGRASMRRLQRPIRPTGPSKEERDRIDAKNAWVAEHRDVVDWIFEKESVSSFANSLVRQFEQGPLTKGQINKVREILAERTTRAAEQVAAVVRAEPAGSDIDLSKIPEGFYAVPGGDTRLKVCIERPSPPSKWSGFIFVSDGAKYGQQKKYGRQAPGKLYTGDIKDALRAIVADPKAASAAYGKLVGRCGLCGRKLEDEASIARGIGPVCAEKFNGNWT